MTVNESQPYTAVSPPVSAQQPPQMMQNQPTFVVFQPRLPAAPPSPASSLRIVVLLAVLFGSFSLLYYTWELVFVYGSTLFPGEADHTFIIIIFPILHVLLWLSGLAIVVLPNYKAMQISWVFVSLLHALTSLAGIGHFLFLAIEYWDIMWHYMAMFIWSPLLQMLELMLLGSSIILMITYNRKMRDQNEVGTGIDMSVFAEPQSFERV